MSSRSFVKDMNHKIAYTDEFVYNSKGLCRTSHTFKWTDTRQMVHWCATDSAEEHL